jgi:hypothetical protein
MIAIFQPMGVIEGVCVRCGHSVQAHEFEFRCPVNIDVHHPQKVCGCIYKQGKYVAIDNPPFGPHAMGDTPEIALAELKFELRKQINEASAYIVNYDGSTSDIKVTST